jgi:hypothetical protein
MWFKAVKIIFPVAVCSFINFVNIYFTHLLPDSESSR